MSSKCEHCGTTIIDDCWVCGAPQCCPKCCEETTKELLESRKTTVVSIRKKRGQPRFHCDVYCGRPSIYGNPFLIGRDGDRKQVLEKYKKYFYEKIKDPYFLEKVLYLKGKVLGCYCSPLECHCDIIAEYLNNIK